MFQELIWFRRLCQSVNGVSDAVIKANVSLLFSWPFSKQHCFKKQTSAMGKQVFWVSVQSSAGCKPLAFLQ